MLTPYPPTRHAARIVRRRAPSDRPARILATALACLLLSFLLQGCGGGADEDCAADEGATGSDTTTALCPAAEPCAPHDSRTPPPNTPALCAANPTACI